MLYRILSHVCNYCVVVLGLIPFAAIEWAPDHLLGYLFGSALAWLGCYFLYQFSEKYERKAKRQERRRAAKAQCVRIEENSQAA